MKMPAYKTTSNLINILSIVISISLLSSCVGFNPRASKGGKELYETFYVGENKTQYFIRPIELEQDDSKFKIDFTFRDLGNTKSDVTTNFSIISESPAANPDSIIFETDSASIKGKNLSKLFLEKDNDEYHLRTTSELTFEELDQIFQSKKLVIKVYTKKKDFIFTSEGKFDKKRNEIYSSLIEVLIL